MRSVRTLMHIMRTMPMPMPVVRGPHILHLIRAAALRAALHRAVARARQPDDDVRVDGAACAADVLLVAEGFDDDGVCEGAWKEGSWGIS